MEGFENLTRWATLFSEPSRLAMVAALMSGRAHTATELAVEGGVAPSTASSHFELLVTAGIVERVRQGRHRYYRISDPSVADAIEQLMGVPLPGTRLEVPRVGQELARARTCYDHLAGHLAVRWFEELINAGYIIQTRTPEITDRGKAAFERWGFRIDWDRGNRPLCKTCLDWSERRFHAGGVIGTELLRWSIEKDYIHRLPGTRALDVTVAGEHFLKTLELGH